MNSYLKISCIYVTILCDETTILYLLFGLLHCHSSQWLFRLYSVADVITIIKVHTIYLHAILVPFDLSFRNGVRVAMELNGLTDSCVNIVWRIYKLFERWRRYITHIHLLYIL